VRVILSVISPPVHTAGENGVRLYALTLIRSRAPTSSRCFDFQTCLSRGSVENVYRTFSGSRITAIVVRFRNTFVNSRGTLGWSAGRRRSSKSSASNDIRRAAGLREEPIVDSRHIRRRISTDKASVCTKQVVADKRN